MTHYDLSKLTLSSSLCCKEININLKLKYHEHHVNILTSLFVSGIHTGDLSTNVKVNQRYVYMSGATSQIYSVQSAHILYRLYIAKQTI